MIRYSEKYTQYFNENCLMGPNSVRLIDELLIKYPLKFNRKNEILDLGCGTGLTSLFISNETGATVYANDLWIKKEENYSRFINWHVESAIIPSCEDANELSFEKEKFDAIISIDSYHYFAREKAFFAGKILPYMKKGGLCLIGIPGMKEDYEGRQQELLTEWLGDEAEMFHSCSWWKDTIGIDQDIENVDTWEMDNFNIAWDEWLGTDNEYAKGDKKFYESIIRKYTTFVGIVVKKREKRIEIDNVITGRDVSY